jgi:hypothetical protein
MHDSREKQISFNETVAINPGLSELSTGFSLDKATLVCVNVGGRMRGTQEDRPTKHGHITGGNGASGHFGHAHMAACS